MINSIIDKIVTEWAYRVHNGMPNPSDNYHLVQLDEAMTSMKLPRKFREVLLNRVRGLEEDDEYSGIHGNPPKGKRETNPNPPPKYKYNYDDGSAGGKSTEEERGKYLKKREEVFDELELENGEKLSESQRESLRANQDATLKFLRSSPDSIGKKKGMKLKQIDEKTQQIHERCADLLEKLWSGDSLSDDELEFLSQWVGVVEPNASSPKGHKIYVAREAGNFNRLAGMPAAKIGKKTGFGANSQGQAMQKWMQKQGVGTIRTSTYAGKLTTANQTFTDDKGETKLLTTIPPGNVSRNKKGKVEKVKLSGNLTLTRVPETKNETNVQRKQREQNNAQLDEYARLIEKGDLEMIDMDTGVAPDTPDNRKIVIGEALGGIAKRLTELGNRPIPGVPEGPNNPPPPDATAVKIIKRIEALSKKDPNTNPEEWYAELNGVMADMAEHETLGEAFANVAEVYDAIKTMQGAGAGTEHGSATFLPESTTLETVDILTVRESGEGQSKIVTIDGRSVKKGGGGASQLTAKITKSRLRGLKARKVKNKNGEVIRTYPELSAEDVKKKATALSRKHEDIYKHDDAYESGASGELIQKEKNQQDKIQRELEEQALELGVEPAYIEYIKKQMNERKTSKAGKESPSEIESAVAGIMAIRKDDAMPPYPPPPSEKEIKAMMTKRMENYYLYQAMSHRAYNKNVQWQGFANDSFSVKKGEITVDESDGVEKLAWPRFAFNLGFSATGRSSNAGGGRFHNSDFNDPAWEKW